MFSDKSEGKYEGLGELILIDTHAHLDMVDYSCYYTR